MAKDTNDKIKAMKREAWIKNVLKIYPEKTRKETEELHDKIFPEWEGLATAQHKKR